MSIIKKIKITTQREYTNKAMKRDEKRRRRALEPSWLHLLFFLTGVAAVLFGIGDNSEMSVSMYSYGLMFLTAFSAFLWYFYFFHKRIFLVIAIVLALATAVIFVPELWTNASRLFAGQALNVSAPMIISGLILLVFVLFSLEFILRLHSIVLLFSLLFIVGGPAAGLQFGYAAVILSLLFNVAFIIVNMTENRSGRNFFRMNDRNKVYVWSTLIAAAIVAISLAPAFPIENAAEKQLFSSTGTATKIISDTTAAVVESVTANLAPAGITAEGKIHRSNLTYQGETLMTVRIDKVPDTPIYMHGFQGGSYENGEWKSAFVETVYNDVNKDQAPYQEPFIVNVINSIHGHYPTLMKNTSDPISDIYYNYFTELHADSKDTFHVEMEEKNETYSTVCTPYFSKYSEGNIRMKQKIGENGYANVFTYGKNVNMDGHWSYYAQAEVLVEAYMERIQTEYTGIPENNNTSLKQLCAANPLENVKEITAFIVSTIQNRAEYTDQTGIVPFDKDVIDYFLFDSGKGDSVYYASAATLMYRMYGIPARYVSGFIVRPDDFQKKDGGYTASVSDRQAYSWTEIFFKNYGWVPIDVCPDSEGHFHTEFPGFDTAAMEKLMAEKGWQFIDHSAVRHEEEVKRASYNWTPLILIAVGTVLTGIAITVAVIIVKRKKAVAIPQQTNCRVIFDKLVRAIHFAGLLSEYNGSESEFYVQLSEAVPEVSQEEAEKMFTILCKDSFAPDSEEGSQSDAAFIGGIYTKTSSHLYQHMNWYQRIIFKYVKNLM